MGRLPQRSRPAARSQPHRPRRLRPRPPGQTPDALPAAGNGGTDEQTAAGGAPRAAQRHAASGEQKARERPTERAVCTERRKKSNAKERGHSDRLRTLGVPRQSSRVTASQPADDARMPSHDAAFACTHARTRMHVCVARALSRVRRGADSRGPTRGSDPKLETSKATHSREEGSRSHEAAEL